MARRTLAVFAALAALAATPALAGDIDFSVNDQICRAEEYGIPCVIPTENQTRPFTIQKIAEAVSQHPLKNTVSSEQIIKANGWEGATPDTLIPVGVAFRLR